MTERVTAYLGLGSNMGKRLAYLRSAVDALGENPHAKVRGLSSVYESEPDGPLQENYYNMAVQIDTTLTPNELLALCQKVEGMLGRVRVQHWGPRTIDVDILLYGDLELDQDQPRLIIPHPRMYTREFVCAPLADLVPPDEMPDTSGCIAGRIVRKVGDLYRGAKPKGA